MPDGSDQPEQNPEATPVNAAPEEVVPKHAVPESGLNVCYRIREIRQDELPEVVAFAKAHGREIDPTEVRTWLSLVARDAQGQVRGAAFCLAGARTSVTLDVVIADDAHAHETEAEEPTGSTGQAAQAADQPSGNGVSLAQWLIDKVLGKMRCQHVNRCSIHVQQAPTMQNIWSATRWADDAVGCAA